MTIMNAIVSHPPGAAESIAPGASRPALRGRLAQDGGPPTLADLRVVGVAPVASAEEGQQTREEDSGRAVEPLVAQVNRALVSFTSLHFTMDHDLNQVVVSVVDRNTNEVIRQIPTEQVRELADRMEALEGILYDATA
ncbi:MAG: flagellar protein FlaG [Magnetococcus sp. WYHC-3]